MFIIHLLTQLTSGSRRRCRMCGGPTTGQSRWCGTRCQTEYLDFWTPGA